MLVRLLKRKDIQVGRKHVRALMTLMDIKALCCKPSTRRRNGQHKISL